METTVENIRQSIKHFRRWRLMSVAALLARIPAIICLGWLLSHVIDSIYAFAAALAISSIAVWLIGDHVASWPCPVCGKPLLKTKNSYNTLASHCLHCGSPI